MLSRDVVQERATELFAPFASFNVSWMTRPFNCKNPPPQVNIPFVVFLMLFLFLRLPSSELMHLWKDPFAGMISVLLRRAEGRLAVGSRCPATDVA